jgi:hypothetical protein
MEQRRVEQRGVEQQCLHNHDYREQQQERGHLRSGTFTNYQQEQFHLICIHEASHAVTYVREGGTLDCVDVFIAPRGYEQETTKYTYYTSVPSPLVTCAGQYAAERFASASSNLKDSGAELDFESLRERLCAGSESAASALWMDSIAELHARYDDDCTFEAQVRAVAAAVREKGYLNHNQVQQIMSETLSSEGKNQKGAPEDSEVCEMCSNAICSPDCIVERRRVDVVVSTLAMEDSAECEMCGGDGPCSPDCEIEQERVAGLDNGGYIEDCSQPTMYFSE